MLLGDSTASTSFEDTLNNAWLTDDTVRENKSGCFSCTIELQNPGSLHEQHATLSADGLYRYLQHVGALSEAPVPLPKWSGCAVQYNDVVSVVSDRGGLVILRVNVGDSVHEGQIVAQILQPAPAQPHGRRHFLRAPCAGTVLMMASNCTLLSGGQTACAIVPTAPVARLDPNYMDVDRFG